MAVVLIAAVQQNHKILVNPGKEEEMIYTKDGLTKERFIELLQYSLEQECQFLFPIKPNTSVVNDHVFQMGSAVRLLKVEERFHEDIQSDGEKIFSHRFSVKVLVEDHYFVKGKDNDKYYKSGRVPSNIHDHIARILNRMETEKWPPIDPGTPVKTIKPNMKMRNEWTAEGWASRQWGVQGTIITHHDSHGLCYDVQHPDGTVGCYDPSELEILK